MSRKKNGGYKVGYGKPPKPTQFRKGQSGNSKGRPKKSRNVHTILMETLNQRIPVRENGRTKSIPLRDAYVKKMTEKALNGNIREMLAFLKEIERIAPELLENENQTDEVVVTFVMPSGKKMDADEYHAKNPGPKK